MTRREPSLVVPAVTADLARELELARRELALERELERRRLANPLAHIKWSPPQLAFLKCAEKRKLLRTGNQLGKTWAGGAEAIWFALGSHPYQRGLPAPPTLQWVICATERQSQIVQKKVWQLVPKAEVAEGCYYDPRKGAFVGKYARLRFRNGSEIHFITGGGDTTSLASDTVHRVWIDEPPESERVYNEVQSRLIRTNGWLAITLTPVNRPVAWLRALAEKEPKPLIKDLHFRLEPQNLVLENGEVMRLEDGTPMDEAWIEDLIARTSEMEVPVIRHGEWEFRTEGAYLAKVWDPATMIVDGAPEGRYEELLGIDWGDRPGKQVVLYILVDEEGGRDGYPRVHVEACYTGETGRETVLDDARGTVRMLRAHGTQWANLRSVKADRAHRAKQPGQKGTFEFNRAIAEVLGVPLETLHPLAVSAKRGPGRGKGSRTTRSSWLHELMAARCFTVNRRCGRLIEAFPKYNPLKDDDNKDPVDALVYGIDEYIYRPYPRVYQPTAMWG